VGREEDDGEEEEGVARKEGGGKGGGRGRFLSEEGEVLVGLSVLAGFGARRASVLGSPPALHSDTLWIFCTACACPTHLGSPC
jgi:hypothetical protein